MKIENILEVEKEAKRFLSRIEEVRRSESNSQAFEGMDKTTHTSKETGALKRASMDLTRSLSKMRNETY